VDMLVLTVALIVVMLTSICDRE